MCSRDGVAWLVDRRSAREYSFDLQASFGLNKLIQLEMRILHLVGLVSMQAMLRTVRLPDRDRACVGSVAMVVRAVVLATVFSLWFAFFCSLSRSIFVMCEAAANSTDKACRGKLVCPPPPARPLLPVRLIRTM